jgi:hypothetical protein
MMRLNRKRGVLTLENAAEGAGKSGKSEHASAEPERREE